MAFFASIFKTNYMDQKQFNFKAAKLPSPCDPEHHLSSPWTTSNCVQRNSLRKTHLIVGYFGLWAALAFLALFLNAINVDWKANPRWLGITIVMIAGLLQGSVLELVAMATTTAYLGGHRRQTQSAPFEHLSMILNYNLLAVSEDDIDETFRTMYEAYMGNLAENVSAVLVSATNDPKLKQYELDARDSYRERIYNTLLDEGLSFANGKYECIDKFHLRYVWFKYVHLSREIFLDDYLDKVCRRFAQEFMCVHRVSRVLKKCGQYQDLMLLSEGDNTAFSYTDPKFYGRSARSYGEPLFYDSGDVRNIRGRRYDYTLVLDGDTAVFEGSCFELLAIAAAYPERGIVQPAIKMDVKEDDTLFMHIENVRQQVNDPITNALTEMLGQSGFYGKGLVRNRVYIDNVIGTRENPIERVPIDVLSHDTFEAACLRPVYASNVFLLEAPCLNYVTWDMREMRWNKGEIILAMYFWPRTVGLLLRYFQRRTFGKDFVPTLMRTESKFDFVSAYVAHSALRNMFMKPLLLVYLLVHMFVQLHYPLLPICAIMFLILVYPKFAVYNGHNFKLILIEVVTSIFQFTPEAFVGSMRVLRAIYSNLDKNAKWVPQRAVEEEFRQKNPFVSSFRHLWMFSLSAAIITVVVVFLDRFAVNRNYLMFTMIGTLFLLPLYTAVTTMTPAILRYFSKKYLYAEWGRLPGKLCFYSRHYLKPNLDFINKLAVQTNVKQKGPFYWDALV